MTAERPLRVRFLRLTRGYSRQSVQHEEDLLGQLSLAVASLACADAGCRFRATSPSIIPCIRQRTSRGSPGPGLSW